jgi:beta-galactosidase
VFIEFDGVMANSEVWINGHSLGRRPSGYVSFRYELTGQLNFGAGQTNLLAVRTDTSGQPASRWYTGAGIYRHVRLVTTDPVHLEAWSTFVTTPQISDAEARVSVQTTVRNDTAAAVAATVETRCIDPAGTTVATASAPLQLPPHGMVNVAYYVSLPQPQRWELDAPRLYRAVTRVLVGGRATDEETVTFGIRESHFEPATGFWLNGKNFKLKGVCLHQDGGAFGVAVPLGVWEQRLTELKKLGVNAIRTAHNAVAPGFLDLCDRMGFLVMDEFFDAWTVAKRPYDYARYFNDWALIDARDSIRRDRNHPSIVLYSAGNEIHDTPQAELAKKILGSLLEVYHREDPTRPVTQALLRPNRSHDYDDGLADMLDVVGQNYRESEILAAYHQKPTRKILGTENGHDLRVWLPCRDNPFYSGQFLWSGIDYLGESRRWPSIASGSGLLDRTGAPKARAFERQSWWSDRPMVAIVRRLGADRPTATDPGYEARRRPRRRWPGPRYLPIGPPPTSRPTRKTSKSTATASGWNCSSTANPSARSRARPTTRPAPGRSPLPRDRSRPSPKMPARSWPPANSAPPANPPASRSPWTGRSSPPPGTMSPASRSPSWTNTACSCPTPATKFHSPSPVPAWSPPWTTATTPATNFSRAPGVKPTRAVASLS